MKSKADKFTEMTLREMLNVATVKLELELRSQDWSAPTPVMVGTVNGLALALALVTGEDAKNLKVMAEERAHVVICDQDWRREVELWGNFQQRLGI